MRKRQGWRRRCGQVVLAVMSRPERHERAEGMSYQVVSDLRRQEVAAPAARVAFRHSATLALLVRWPPAVRSTPREPLAASEGRSLAELRAVERDLESCDRKSVRRRPMSA
jgi:hypothetical protein